MQRLGYLKRLIRRVTSLSSSSLDNLGHDLIDTVTRKIRVPLDDARAEYIKLRLYDRAYGTLKTQTEAWLKSDRAGEPPVMAMELQDLYLSDPSLPSRGGKLVKADLDRYVPLGISLGLIRGGTYSANTRALSFLYFTPDTEIQAFVDYKPEFNPMRISRQQGLLLLYAFLENDGEVIAPLFRKLMSDYPSGFSDRNAGDQLPEIYRSITARHRARALSVEARERLASLEKTAESIARRREIERYVGSAREEASRVRVEPYVDMGLFNKPDPFKFEYTIAPAGQKLIESLNAVDSSEQVEAFLQFQFFSTCAKAWNIDAQVVTEPECIVPYLYRAWEKIQSPGGYSPIEELALVGGIRALLEHNVVFETGVAREAIIAYQKANPYQVRFTVNRLGVLAHTRFLEPPPSPLLDKCQ